MPPNGFLLRQIFGIIAVPQKFTAASEQSRGAFKDFLLHYPSELGPEIGVLFSEEGGRL